MLNSLLEIQDTGPMREHKLEGFLYSQHQELLAPDLKKSCAIRWLHQKHQNQLLWTVMEQIDDLLHQHHISAVVLKGLSFFGRIYSDYGSRAISDIDLYIAREHQSSLNEILQSQGFQLQADDDHWEGNHHKSLWQTPAHWNPATIELHFDLFYHRQKMAYPEFKEFGKFRALKLLEPHLELSYLIGHLAFQHTFLKLFWSLDIERLYRYEADKIDSNKMVKIADDLGLFRSHQMVFYMLLNFFKTPLRQDLCEAFALSKPAIWKLFFTKQFLLRGRQFGVQYYVIKHATKDSLTMALSYDLLWLRHQLKKYLRSFLAIF